MFYFMIEDKPGSEARLGRRSLNSLTDVIIASTPPIYELLSSNKMVNLTTVIDVLVSGALIAGTT
jgi:hypothetical protein